MRSLFLIVYGLTFAIAPQVMRADQPAKLGLPIESGQSAFAAIHEIVQKLEADPQTDWSKVNIGFLRAHLADMDNVTLHAAVEYEIRANGMLIHVVGEGPLRASIKRMIFMHAAMAGDTLDWHMNAIETERGADLNVVAKNPQALQKIKALGLFGMLAEGSHHGLHHLMLARGSM